MKKHLKLKQVDWVDSHQNWKTIKKNIEIATWQIAQGDWHSILANIKNQAVPNWLESNGSWRDYFEAIDPLPPQASPQIIPIVQSVVPQIEEIELKASPEIDELTIDQLESYQPHVIDDEVLAVLKREELFLKQALSIASTFLPTPLQYAIFVPPPILSQNSQIIRQLQGSYLFAIHPEYLILATIDRKNKWAFDSQQIAMLFFNQGYFHIRLNDGKELAIDLSKFDDHLQRRLESEIQNWSKVIDKNLKTR